MYKEEVLVQDFHKFNQVLWTSEIVTSFAEEKSGIDASSLVDHQVAVAGTAIIANKNISIDNLTTEQLRKIFTGEYTNWKQLGGPDLEITIVNRAVGSGSRAVFDAIIMDGKQPKAGTKQDSNGMVKNIVSQTPGAISYLAFTYLDSSVKTMKLNGYQPTKANVVNNNWPIWSYEHMYTKGKPMSCLKIHWLHDDRWGSAKVVGKMGYIPINDMKVTRDLKGECDKK